MVRRVPWPGRSGAVSDRPSWGETQNHVRQPVEERAAELTRLLDEHTHGALTDARPVVSEP
ncbi:hypothetical protein GCM10010260_60900 [Streptomyces filipinensis]|uniref:Uncharacterized protein n=1 Tax=Streptomyces filipinensis TaxID=66887 RepID=A0A918IHG8_9ACTN|nr:hypothetical protein GCM10010260_60900 [Streptomyces filipinensis]